MNQTKTDTRLMTNRELADSDFLRQTVRRRLKEQKRTFKTKTGQTGRQMQDILGMGAGIFAGMLYDPNANIRFTVERVEMLTRYMGGDVEKTLEFPAAWDDLKAVANEKPTKYKFASNDDGALAMTRPDDVTPLDIHLHQLIGIDGDPERCPFNVQLLSEQMTEHEVGELASISSERMSLQNLTTLVHDLTAVLCNRATQTALDLEVPDWS